MTFSGLESQQQDEWSIDRNSTGEIFNKISQIRIDIFAIALDSGHPKRSLLFDGSCNCRSGTNASTRRGWRLHAADLDGGGIDKLVGTRGPSPGVD
ncbi:hypothetical protein ACVDG5_017095 [Mesorhizobium sp. ORM6]